MLECIQQIYDPAAVPKQKPLCMNIVFSYKSKQVQSQSLSSQIHLREIENIANHLPAITSNSDTAAQVSNILGSNPYTSTYLIGKRRKLTLRLSKYVIFK